VTAYADAAALIDDPRVLRVAITDNGEPLVDIRNIPALAADQTRADVQQLSDNPFQVRTEVAERLAGAQTRLPGGYQIQVKEGWRPVWVQQQLWDLCLEQLRSSKPDLSPEQLKRENARFVAPPGIAPPHSTGGAVDVVLLREGCRAEMGWGFNQPGEGSRTAAQVSAAMPQPSTARSDADRPPALAAGAGTSPRVTPWRAPPGSAVGIPRTCPLGRLFVRCFLREWMVL
jgi:D-alanyl-D-alanine dipeptidase